MIGYKHMRLKTNQSGLAPVLVLLLVLLIMVIAFFAWRFTSSEQPSIAPQNDNSSDQTADESDLSGAPSRVSPANDAYSVELPSGWVSRNCDAAGSEGVLFIAPSEELLGLCASEAGGVVIFSVASGDNRASLSDFSESEEIGDLSSSDITYGEISGTSFSYTIVAESMLGYPPVGTTIVHYQAYDGTNTYFATYTGLPGQQDYLAEFDASVDSFLVAPGP